jgi:Ran GTPase-activating protein (RanGAP) involved in mRNA processing and transport
VPGAVVVSFADFGTTGALSLASGIASCPALTSLDVSWNGLGEAGGIRFGELLTTTSRLRRLNVANCRMTAPAALVFADALRFNSTLIALDLSNNPFGEAGVGRLITVLSMHNSVEKYSLAGTGTSQPASASSSLYHKFDGNNPDGNYRLDLSVCAVSSWGSEGCHVSDLFICVLCLVYAPVAVGSCGS